MYFDWVTLAGRSAASESFSLSSSLSLASLPLALPLPLSLSPELDVSSSVGPELLVALVVVAFSGAAVSSSLADSMSLSATLSVLLLAGAAFFGGFTAFLADFFVEDMVRLEQWCCAEARDNAGLVLIGVVD